MQQIPQSTVDDARNMLLNMVPMMQNLNRNATLTELASQSTRDWSLVLLNLKTVLDFFFVNHVLVGFTLLNRYKKQAGIFIVGL